MSIPMDRTEFQNGDRVRRITEYTVGDYSEGADSTYELVDRPIKLPTESGFYQSGGHDKEVKGTLFLSLSGAWSWVGNKNAIRPSGLAIQRISEYMPLTRLRSEAEVAAEVLAEFTNPNHRSKNWVAQYTQVTLDTIAKKFGVQK
jgi:hypothetical protein